MIEEYKSLSPWCFNAFKIPVGYRSIIIAIGRHNPIYKGINIIWSYSRLDAGTTISYDPFLPLVSAMGRLYVEPRHTSIIIWLKKI